VVDRAALDPRAGLNDPALDIVFSMGPSMRFAAALSRGGARARYVLPGGVSGDANSPFFSDLLEMWLTNDTVVLSRWDGRGEQVELVPARTAGRPRK
jgi:hypothetical protein